MTALADGMPLAFDTKARLAVIAEASTIAPPFEIIMRLPFNAVLELVPPFATGKVPVMLDADTERLVQLIVSVTELKVRAWPEVHEVPVKKLPATDDLMSVIVRLRQLNPVLSAESATKKFPSLPMALRASADELRVYKSPLVVKGDELDAESTPVPASKFNPDPTEIS